MIVEQLIKLVGDLPCFDLALLTQAFDEKRENIRTQLSRWMGLGKIIGLRRGIYTLSDTFRRITVDPVVIANQLYRPSYLSTLWALGFHALIPERVVRFTSVTTRSPERFGNELGVFDYRNIKQEFFFGYAPVKIGAIKVLVADPAKAILDHWHLTSGEWTYARLEEMRYQNLGQVDGNMLSSYAARFRSPRLERALKRWHEIRESTEVGTEIL